MVSIKETVKWRYVRFLRSSENSFQKISKLKQFLKIQFSLLVRFWAVLFSHIIIKIRFWICMAFLGTRIVHVVNGRHGAFMFFCLGVLCQSHLCPLFRAQIHRFVPSSVYFFTIKGRSWKLPLQKERSEWIYTLFAQNSFIIERCGPMTPMEYGSSMSLQHCDL